MKRAVVALATIGLLAQFALASAAPLEPVRPFENSLRRSIAVQGQADARFTLADRMAHYRVPGVSVAIIEGCRIVDVRGFGRSAIGGRPITAQTLFQAGSISKSLTAIAALKLVENGTLSLDSDVRPFLKTWTLPSSPLLTGHPVTLRGLLNHTAGINVEGGQGYARGAALPSLADILEGRSPANNPPIRVETTPGSAWSYSSGGYYIAQALMADTTGEAFPALMDRLVLRPAGMSHSRFEHPISTAHARLAASAVGPDGTPLPGGWRNNPELAASGLWTTPDDLAHLLIVVARAVRLEDNRLLGADTVRQMMKRGPGNWGLGVDLGRPDGPRRFGHTGQNVGFSSEYVMFPDSCQGAVVMTNADEGSWLATEVLRAIGDSYGWPGGKPSPVQADVPMTDTIAARFVGKYRLRDFPAETFAITRKADGGLYWARTGHIGRDLLAEGDGKLFSPDSRMTLEAEDPGSDRAAKLDLTFGGGKNVAERVE
jgi:CubicO group peptidase (beta-lactamase class C family)